MRVLVTGANGFVGKNLCLALGRMEGVEVFRYDLGNTRAELEEWAGTCDFVFHLAGVNRPKDPAEFAKGNAGFTEELLALLARRPVPVLLSSSIQAALDNDYGKSKAAAEESVRAYGARTGAPVYVYRLANVFGKWCRPNYNSAVATWCHNIARELPIQVRDPAATVTLVYIDDVVESFIGCLEPRNTRNTRNEFLSVEPSYTKSLGEIVELVRSFHDEPKTLDVPDQRDGFAKKLYATYLSYLPEDQFAYPLTMHVDNRGSFTEILHTAERGQVSVNVSRPGITKGQHWHHTKHEKFLVVSGEGAIRFRKMDDPSAQVITYRVSGAKLEVVRIPPGYTHNIENLGTTDMVTVMWANEVFDPQRPDTFREEV
ncbi:MAG: NAD-dependent epimerase/dehydratase family protein [Kiritimatiellae bacterium]|nr:NAD-dependent epimerase/dehydratase family protein [Kiritimatiellia bacterium]